MKRHLLLLLWLLSIPMFLAASEEMTLAQAKRMYTTESVGRVSVHDPSIVWEPSSKMYYLFGTHRGQVKSRDLFWFL